MERLGLGGGPLPIPQVQSEAQEKGGEGRHLRKMFSVS